MTRASSSVTVKVCGLTSNRDAHAAERLGASHVGVIFAGGPRHQTLESAASVLLGLTRVRRVGVFGSQSDDLVLHTVDTLALDVVQLHAPTSVERIVSLRARTTASIWPVVAIEGGLAPVEVDELMDAAEWLLLDSRVGGRTGGTGVPFDWEALAATVHRVRHGDAGRRIVLAGGLRADNVAEGIRLLKPDVVDVSSGVEQVPGIKDHDAMRAFIQAVKHPRHAGEVDVV